MAQKKNSGTATFESGRGNTLRITFPEIDHFDVSIRLLKQIKTYVPLGIKDYNGTPENKGIPFEIEVIENGVDDLKVDFYHNDTIIQTYYSALTTLDEVVITADRPTDSSSESKEEKSSNDEEVPKNYPVDTYAFSWDGFDSNRVYDSTIFTNGTFKVIVTATRNGVEKTAETDEFSFKYDEVRWVDTKIDDNAKRIDITLRVEFEDGGANGIECSEHVLSRKCPWDKIPSNVLNPSRPPIKSRLKSFADLERLALDGLDYHWGRNRNHTVAKNVDIDGELYEVYVKAVNTSENAMDDVSLVFNTNEKWMRSGNPGTVDDPISFVGNIVSREAICYNVGYIKYSNGWDYQPVSDEDISFKETAAHEIGHTILKAYGGTFYSYGHKGTVNTVTQSSNSTATAHPTTGEIDIMPYYTDYLPSNQRNRMAAAAKDVLGLIWLTKIKLK
jgi:hypothetical protein